MTLQHTLVRFLLATLATGSLAGCQGMKHDEPPIVPIRNMYNQPRYDAQDEQDFWEDGRAMRMPVAGAVSREMEPNLSFATGRSEDDSRWLLETPAPIMASEDFSYYLKEIPGAFALIGAGTTDDPPSCHSPHYDFNDDILTVGAKFWAALVEQQLPLAE